MKKLLKILGYILGVIVIIVAGLLIYFNATYPKVAPAANIKIEVTPARIERGKYLANHVTVCIDCHSERDWNKFAGPIKPGTFGEGGELFNKETAGVPGMVYARNITPAGIGSWTDGEILRTITCGVNKNGKALFPIMPYIGYNHLTQEDAYSIVAYIRSLQPVKNDVPESSLDFPMSLIVKTIPPESYTPSQPVDKSDTVAYGKYLVTIAACFDCHTQMDKGQYIQGMSFAGGFEFHMPSGITRSANITPDEKTGIGKWSKEQFINKFKSFDPDSATTANVDMKKDFNTPMPWIMFGGMTREDLGAIYTYLRTIPAVNYSPIKFTPNK